MAKGNCEAAPSRVVALSYFIWKHFMAAFRATTGSSRPSVV